jgi:hypothetical protein
LVTGGSKGIGRAVCMALARPGDVVAFNHFDPDESEADKTIAMLEDAGVTALAKKFDVADPDQVKEFMDQLVEAHGSLDVLVNNAGITMDALLVRMSLEQFERVIRVNLVGAFVCLQAAAKIMMKQRAGCIVNVASLVGQIGNIGQANYSASKGGLIALTKTAAKELAARGSSGKRGGAWLYRYRHDQGHARKGSGDDEGHHPHEAGGTARGRGRCDRIPLFRRRQLSDRPSASRKRRHVYVAFNGPIYSGLIYWE